MGTKVLLIVALGAVAWIGHACLLTFALNVLYGCPIPKWILRPYRLATGVAILAFPLIYWSAFEFTTSAADWRAGKGLWNEVAMNYIAIGFAVGAVALPLVTIARLLRKPPVAVIGERTETIDFGKQLGPAAIGASKWAWLTRLPLNDCFKVDFTELTLALRGLPPRWDGLTILFVSDLHFYGSPGRPFFEAVLDRLAAGPRPDLVLLGGDYLDTDRHHDWIVPLLGRLAATEGKFAILGNHDQHHDPDRVRAELTAAGYTVLDNVWQEVSIRGEPCVLIGHEGPWFRPGPDLSAASVNPFRLCLSHTPDNFYWGHRNWVGLMLAGHVHGGQIRLPLIGSIFVPSIYSRRFDMGVFQRQDSVLVVGRGLSGKEPIRFRCPAQVMRLTLKPG